jgi:hypothetical protein
VAVQAARISPLESLQSLFQRVLLGEERPASIGVAAQDLGEQLPISGGSIQAPGSAWMTKSEQALARSRTLPGQE